MILCLLLDLQFEAQLHSFYVFIVVQFVVVKRILQIVELKTILEVNRIEEFGAFNHGLLISDLRIGSSHISKFDLQFTLHAHFFNPNALYFLSRLGDRFFLQRFGKVLIVLSDFHFVNRICHCRAERMLISLLIHSNVFQSSLSSLDN